jgi:hypothetical protein
MTTNTAARRGLPLALGWLGLALHLAVGYVYLTVGLVAPLWGVLSLWTLWLIMLAAAVWLLMRHPVWALAVPAAAVLILVGTLWFGGSLLGWSA